MSWLGDQVAGRRAFANEPPMIYSVGGSHGQTVLGLPETDIPIR